MADRQEEFLEKLKELQQEFITSLVERLEQLKRHRHKLSNDWNIKDLQQFYIDIHTLAGSGATFGFNRLSHTAKQLEDRISPFLQFKNDIPTAAQYQAIESAFCHLESLLENIIAHADEPYLVVDEDLSAIVGEIQQNDTQHESSNILLIEDDEVLAKNLSEQIQAFNYQVTLRHDTADIETVLKSEKPCALIIDIILPEGENAGVEIINKIRTSCQNTLPKHVPIIFISCRADIEARLEAVKAGGNAYLVKPVDAGNLIEWLDKLLSRQPEEAYQVLIVDDDKEVAKHHALILENGGILTRICNRPIEILKAMENFHPDLILMDLYMPGYRGNELASAIRQIDIYAAVPIIYLSTERSGELQIQALLQGGDDFLIKPIRAETLVRIVAYKAQRFRKLRDFMTKDGLTELYNHRHIKEYIKNEFARASRDKTPVSVAMFDVDHFKNVNDTYGHSIGDKVLKVLARFLKDRVRKTDLVGRYGGEEFLIVFPKTSADIAARLCEKMRGDFEKVLHFYNGGSFRVTFSCGIAAYPGIDDPQLLSDAADSALYESKKNGRNRITVAPECQSAD